jgi:hypothetical protein
VFLPWPLPCPNAGSVSDFLFVYQFCVNEYLRKIAFAVVVYDVFTADELGHTATAVNIFWILAKFRYS